MEYQIKGGAFPVLICQLQSGESMITESGGMSWMSANIEMKTQGTGGVGKSLGRIFTGDSIFQNKYTAKNVPGEIAFTSSFPGEIIAVNVSQEPIVAQKSAFLASEESVELSVFFRKKLGTGLFGGEGFIMQSLKGEGMAFLEIDGATMTYDLKEKEKIIVDTGYLAYMSTSCKMDIERVKGAKNMFFGGEGLFNTIITGPGKVVLQTMPMYQVAGVLQPYMVTESK